MQQPRIIHTAAIFALLTLVLAACGDSADKVRKREGETGGLAAEEYNRLADINRMQQDNIDARDAAFKPVVSAALNEKSKAMSDKIRGCTKDGEIPADDFSGTVHQQTIGGPSCPLTWYRRRGWKTEEKVMIVEDSLEIRDPEYLRTLAPMAVRKLGGFYRLQTNGNGTRVEGTIDIDAIQTSAYGRITGKIKLGLARKAGGGAGSVELSLNGRGWANTALMSWQVRNGAVANMYYRVNNTVLDKEQFMTLFSGFEFDKYMDNAMDMK